MQVEKVPSLPSGKSMICTINLHDNCNEEKGQQVRKLNDAPIVEVKAQDM